VAKFSIVGEVFCLILVTVNVVHIATGEAWSSKGLGELVAVGSAHVMMFVEACGGKWKVDWIGQLNGLMTCRAGEIFTTLYTLGLDHRIIESHQVFAGSWMRTHPSSLILPLTIRHHLLTRESGS